MIAFPLRGTLHRVVVLMHPLLLAECEPFVVVAPSTQIRTEILWNLLPGHRLVPLLRSAISRATQSEIIVFEEGANAATRFILHTHMIGARFALAPDETLPTNGSSSVCPTLWGGWFIWAGLLRMMIMD